MLAQLKSLWDEIGNTLRLPAKDSWRKMGKATRQSLYRWWDRVSHDFVVEAWFIVGIILALAIGALRLFDTLAGSTPDTSWARTLSKIAVVVLVPAAYFILSRAWPKTIFAISSLPLLAVISAHFVSPFNTAVAESAVRQYGGFNLVASSVFACVAMVVYVHSSEAMHDWRADESGDDWP